MVGIEFPDTKPTVKLAERGQQIAAAKYPKLVTPVVDVNISATRSFSGTMASRNRSLEENFYCVEVQFFGYILVGLPARRDIPCKCIIMSTMRYRNKEARMTWPTAASKLLRCIGR